PDVAAEDVGARAGDRERVIGRRRKEVIADLDVTERAGVIAGAGRAAARVRLLEEDRLAVPALEVELVALDVKTGDAVRLDPVDVVVARARCAGRVVAEALARTGPEVRGRLRAALVEIVDRVIEHVDVHEVEVARVADVELDPVAVTAPEDVVALDHEVF